MYEEAASEFFPIPFEIKGVWPEGTTLFPPEKACWPYLLLSPELIFNDLTLVNCVKWLLSWSLDSDVESWDSSLSDQYLDIPQSISNILMK